jgi:hypothetical protein
VVSSSVRKATAVPEVLERLPRADQVLDAHDTTDINELIGERQRAAATVVTLKREPVDWLGLMADAVLAQSAIDRLQFTAHELVLEGESASASAL